MPQSQLFKTIDYEEKPQDIKQKRLFSSIDYEEAKDPGVVTTATDYIDEMISHPFFNFLKQGYNESMTGLIQQVASGEAPFDLEEYDPNVLEDFAAGIVGFFMPADLAAMGAGGGLGGFAVKSAGKQALKQMVRAGIKKEFAEKTVVKGMNTLVAKVGVQAGGGAGGLGTYGGLHNVFRQLAETGDVDWEEAGKEALKMSTVGAVTGGVLGRAQFKGVSKAGQLAQEIGAFGTAEPIVDLRVPMPMDYVHAASTIIGIKGARRTYTTGKKALKGRFGERKTPIMTTVKQDLAGEIDVKKASEKYLTGTAKEVQKIRLKEEKKEQLWSSKRKGFQSTQIVNDRVDKYGNKVFDIKDTASGETLTLSKNLFFKEFDLFKKPFTQKELAQKRIREVTSLGKRLLSKKYGFSKEFLSETKKNLFGNKELRTKDMTPRQIFKYREKLKKEKGLVDIKKELKPILYEFEPGKTLFQRIFPEEWIDPFLSAEARAKRKESKSLGAIIPKAEQRRWEITGTFVEKAVTQSGLRKYKDPVAVSYALEGKQGAKDYYKLTGKRIPKEAERIAKKVRVELDNAIKLAKKSGIDVAGYLDNYYPRMMRVDIQNIIFDDTLTYYNKNKKLLEKNITNKKDLRILNKMIEASLNAGEFNKHTSKAIKQLVTENKLSYKEALEYIRTESASEMYSPFGNIEKKRLYDLPSEFYERNSKEVLVRYFSKLGKRVGHAELFGVKGEKAKALLKALRSTPEEHRVMQEIYNNITGLTSIDPSKQLSGKAKKIADGFMSFEYATKIGLGTSTVPNVTQSLISSITEAGYYRFARAALRLINPKVRERIRRSGATLHNVMDMMLGTDFGVDPRNWIGPIKKLVKEKGINNRIANVANLLATVSGFKGINYLNQVLAASVADVYVMDLHKIVKKASRDIKRGKDKTSFKARRYHWATRNLVRLGIEKYHKPKLTEKNREGAMYRFAKESQLQKDILKDPLIFNDPRFRPLAIFKRFGYRQAKYQKDLHRREVFDHGNVLVPLRLAAGGMLGVGFVKWGIDGIKEFFSGEDVVRDDPEGMWEKAIDALGNVGALGFFSDILDAEDKLKSILWQLNPVLFSDIGKGVKALNQLVYNVGTFGIDSWIGFQRSIKGFSQLGGAVVKSAALRAETPSQTKERISTEKGRIRRKAMEYMLDGNTERAITLINEWNESGKGNLITPDDINFSELMQFIVREQKKQTNP